MSSILDKIVKHKLLEIARAKLATPTADLRLRATDTTPPLNFFEALTGDGQADRVSLIAEVKKASPSKGVIRQDFSPQEIAVAYADNGASCISVLTDEHFFQGSLAYLKQVRQAVSIPVLRKDFILDPHQVFEARAAGADAVLLIAECLEPSLMKDLHDLIVELGMTPLVELYDARNVDAVLDCNPTLVGVNNRDLNTFEIDLNHSLRIKKDLPSGIAMVSESGIFTNEDVRLMQRHQVDAILVGESLMRANNIGAAVKALLDLGN